MDISIGSSKANSSDHRGRSYSISDKNWQTNNMEDEALYAATLLLHISIYGNR